MKITPTVALAIILSMLSSTAMGDFEYFSWSQSSTNQFDASIGGIVGTMVYSTNAADSSTAKLSTPTDSNFIAEYGSTIPSFTMSNGIAGSSANSLVEIIFNVALPQNAILIAFDVDTIRNDQFQFSNFDSLPFELVQQIESTANANSNFPIWDSTSQTLTSANVGGNLTEASIFDIGGNSTIDIGYFRDSGGNSVGGSVFAIGVAIPEPNAIAILSLLGLSICLRRKRAE